MAKHARYTRVLVDGYDFSGDSNSLSVSIAAAPLETTGFQEAAKSYVMDIGDASISHNGYLVVSDGEGELEKEMYDRLDTTATVAALFGTDDDDCPAYVLTDTSADQFKMDAQLGGVLTVSGNWNGGSGIKRGLRVWTGTFSETGAQTTPAYLDLGEQATAGGYAYLFVQTITGGATDAIILLESDDNTDFTSAATEATFTFSAVGANEEALSGTIDRYIRLNCTDMGTADSFVVVCIACVSGITY